MIQLLIIPIFSGLVHRDVKLDNILVFRSNFSKVKLCDFGESRRCQSTVLRRNEWLPYAPPEVISTAIDNSYKYAQRGLIG
jgi:serine/threonine-protein kinase SBK